MKSSTLLTRTLGCLGFLAVASMIVFAQEEPASSDFPRVKPDELKKMIDTNAPDFLVVSNDPQESFDEGHIPGAVSFPWVNQLKGPVNLPRNKTLILYCACADEEDSSDMAAKLAQFGYRNIKLLDGGILKWTELKYPIEKK
jgi:3-mercaptopyruvate sulfurtransferase SseA